MFALHTELPILFVRTICNTQRALDAFENLRDCNLMRASDQHVPTLGTIVALNQGVLGESLKHFSQQLEGDVIFLRDLFRVHHAPRRYIAELDSSDVLEGHEGIIRFF